MQEAKRQFFDSLPRHPRSTSWGSPLLMFVLFLSHSHPLYADLESSDILDRRDVQSILFDNGSSSNVFNHDSIFRGELVTGQKSLGVNAYYLKALNNFVKSQWGATYEDMHNDQHLVGLKGAVFLGWEKYFIQPFVGADAGFGLFPNKERNLFSHAILGMDFQIAHNFGISARESWGFSSYSFHLMQPFYFRFENAMFEIALFWQI